MIYMGIDPGLDGGIAFLDPSGNDPLLLFKTPTIAAKDYDVQGMKETLRYFKREYLFCTIEQQIALPGQGLTSTLQTGKGFGIWLGLLAGMEISHQVVTAKQWQNRLFSGTSPKLDTKARSEIIAKRLFPTADFRKSDRARVANDGLTDAACIAEYGHRTHRAPDVGSGISHTPGPVENICSVCGRYIPGDILGCIKDGKF